MLIGSNLERGPIYRVAEFIVIGVILLDVLLCWALTYVLLLTVNNVIWGYKGISTDDKSVAHRKRKKLLKFISIPLAIVSAGLVGKIIGIY